jgi:type II secretory pathway component PulM
MRVRWPQSLTRTWDAGRASQRTVAVAIASVVAIAAAMIVVANPLREAIARTREDGARNRVVLDVARARLAENAALTRVAAPVRSPDIRPAVDRALSTQGLRYAVEAQGDAPLRIVVEATPFDALVRALDTLARDDGVRVVEAIVSARVEPGTVRAELALTR